LKCPWCHEWEGPAEEYSRHLETCPQYKRSSSEVPRTEKYKLSLTEILYFDRLPTYGEISSFFREYNVDPFLIAHEYGVFQFWNVEYIDCLAKEINKLVGSQLVLEVAAGDGMLSHYLRQRRVNIIATDSAEWYNTVKRRDKVELLDAVAAIRKYRPIIVIASWLPYEAEIDIAIFDENAHYIILIGEENGATGSPKFWNTEYWKKNYRRSYLEECDRWNICRTDYEGRYFHSSTSLYTRI